MKEYFAFVRIGHDGEMIILKNGLTEYDIIKIYSLSDKFKELETAMYAEEHKGNPDYEIIEKYWNTVDNYKEGYSIIGTIRDCHSLIKEVDTIIKTYKYD